MKTPRYFSTGLTSTRRSSSSRAASRVRRVVKLNHPKYVTPRRVPNPQSRK